MVQQKHRNDNHNAVKDNCIDDDDYVRYRRNSRKGICAVDLDRRIGWGIIGGSDIIAAKFMW